MPGFKGPVKDFQDKIFKAKKTTKKKIKGVKETVLDRGRFFPEMN